MFHKILVLWELFVDQATQGFRATSRHLQLGFVFGLFLIFLQCLIIVGNAVMTQFLFEKFDISSPLIMTYVGCSVMMIMLPIQWIQEHVSGSHLEKKKAQKCNKKDDSTLMDDDDDDDKHHHHDPNKNNNIIETPNLSISETFDSFAEDFQTISNQSQNSISYGYLSVCDVVQRRTQDLIDNHTQQWNHRKHLVAALLLTPAIFLSDWAFNASLQHTSVSSSTVLVSIQSAFVFGMASVLKLESSSALKLMGVVFGIIGTVLTAFHDEKIAIENVATATEEEKYYGFEQDKQTSNENALVVETAMASTTEGDILAIVAAVFYATYSIQVRLYLPQNEDLYSLQLLLGYIGLVSFVFTTPIVVLTMSQATLYAILSWATFGLLLFKGIVDFLISDYLMFRSIVLTSPTIASVGLVLSIPMAFLSDLVLHTSKADDEEDFSLSWYSGSGAACCLIGFLFVNYEQHPSCGDHHNETKIDESSSTVSWYEPPRPTQQGGVSQQDNNMIPEPQHYDDKNHHCGLFIDENKRIRVF